MDGERPRPVEQAALWNGGGGRGWVALQELIDRVFQPIEDLLADAVSPGTTKRVLDVGCGTGGTTVAVARRLGAGSATGIDISEAMIAAARGRAKPGAPPSPSSSATPRRTRWNLAASTRSSRVSE
jgi:SAM-dependent methyltransferase